MSETFLGGPQQAPLVIQAAPIQATSVQTMQQAQNQGQGQQSSQQGHIVWYDIITNKS